jgi:hypothetical protein
MVNNHIWWQTVTFDANNHLLVANCHLWCKQSPLVQTIIFGGIARLNGQRLKGGSVGNQPWRAAGRGNACLELAVS